MRIRKNVEAMAVPVQLIMAAGAGLAIPVPATAAAHTSRPGKVVTGETGAAASPAVSVRTWGDNSAGELGDGTLTQRTTPGTGPVRSSGDLRQRPPRPSANHNAELPVAVTGLPKAVAVAAGGEHSLALRRSLASAARGRSPSRPPQAE